MAGKPDETHHLSKRKQAAKRDLRKAQRIEVALNRQKNYTDIMNAAKKIQRCYIN